MENDLQSLSSLNILNKGLNYSFCCPHFYQSDATRDPFPSDKTKGGSSGESARGDRRETTLKGTGTTELLSLFCISGQVKIRRRPHRVRGVGLTTVEIQPLSRTFVRVTTQPKLYSYVCVCLSVSLYDIDCK